MLYSLADPKTFIVLLVAVLLAWWIDPQPAAELVAAA